MSHSFLSLETIERNHLQSDLADGALINRAKISAHTQRLFFGAEVRFDLLSQMIPSREVQ